MTSTLGIDLASQPKRTAIALITWVERPRLEVCALGRWSGQELDDEFLSKAARGSGFGSDTITKVGIDAPFGWPSAFVGALATYTADLSWPSDVDSSRALFERRETDRIVKASTTSNPLAVSVDKIGYCAMRCAVVLSDLAANLGPSAVARDGSELACEVYPDPALRRWLEPTSSPLLPHQSYKGEANIEVRSDALDAIVEAIGLEDPHGLLPDVMSARQDDLIDAIVCALVARAVELGLTSRPTHDQQSAADREGWIHLPTAPLAALR